MIDTAHNYIAEGFGALPLKNDKSPLLPVGHNYLYNLITETDIDTLFIKAEKIGIACGEVSDNFECIDFDGHNGEPIRKIFNAYIKDVGVKTIVELHDLPIIKTPSGGYHIYYKSDNFQPGADHAKWESGKTMIETRGHGQYVATIPSKGYTHITGSEIIKIARISQDERDYLISIAENFSQKSFEPKQKSGKNWPKKYDESTVWGRYSENEIDEAKDLLINTGWSYSRTRVHDGVELWTRPGKESNPNQTQPTSATFGKYHNMFYVYSSNADPFESWKAYSLFDVFRLLKHNGSKEKAIKELEKRYDIIHYRPTVTKASVNFPLKVFPDHITSYINEQNKTSNFDINLMASSFLWLSSTLIGNRFTTFVNDNWNVSPVLWLMVIADRGSTKTHAINAIIAPAKTIDKNNRKIYEAEMKEYDPEGMEPMPKWKQLFLEDGTREGFVKALKYNPTGLGLMKDELTGWVADMDKHSGGAKGGDEAFWLSSFNNASYTKNIKGDEGSYIGRMFLNLAGSIQPGLINELVKKHTVNGLFDRFLLVPYIEKPFTFSLAKPEFSYFSNYTEFIKYFAGTLIEFDSNGLNFEIEAEKEFEDAYNYFLKVKYNDDNPSIKAYIAKIITYLPRIALIIEVINQVSIIFSKVPDNPIIDTIISKDSIAKAKDVLKYFLNNARDVLIDIDEKTDLNDVIKASGAIRKGDKVRALLESDPNISKVFISEFLGMSKQAVNYHVQKMIKSKESKNK